MTKCMNCKNAIELVGAYTGTHYIECRFEKEFAEHASLEELERMILHPEERPCEYIKGSPTDGGITFDD